MWNGGGLILNSFRGVKYNEGGCKYSAFILYQVFGL